MGERERAREIRRAVYLSADGVGVLPTVYGIQYTGESLYEVGNVYREDTVDYIIQQLKM
jgi:hypothetical protein